MSQTLDDTLEELLNETAKLVLECVKRGDTAVLQSALRLIKDHKKESAGEGALAAKLKSLLQDPTGVDPDE